MAYVAVDEPVRSEAFPEGVSMQPREFTFDDVDVIPQYWNMDNPILTHIENAFSILIPPGERFFIESVRHYERQVTDTEGRELIRAFTRQEGLHGRAHDVFNATIADHGIDVVAEQRYAERLFRRLRRWLPARIRLGVTAFAEHLTAVGAHTLFDDPDVEGEMDPRMLEFWRWHAAEELEHKSVAFDLFTRMGGGYATRMLSVLTAAILVLPPMLRITRSMMKQDSHEPTRAERKQAVEVQRRLFRLQAPLVLAYLRPGFHPWQIDDASMLRAWYREGEVATAG